MKVWEAAVEVLRETGNDGVMWGDSRLLHLIAARAGLPAMSFRTERQVLDRLSRDPGPLVAGLTRLVRPARLVRIFRLNL